MKKLGKWLFCIYSISCIVAGTICVICDYFIASELSWSLIVLLSLLGAWVLLLPFLFKKNIKGFLIAATLIIIPYLATLSIILNNTLVFSMGSCIAALSVITAWSIYGIFAKWRHRIALALGLLFLLSIPASLAISNVPACFVESIHVDRPSDIFHIAVSLLLSAICFVIDFAKTHSGGTKEKQI